MENLIRQFLKNGQCQSVFLQKYKVFFLEFM
jgi:hypothetical protein